jgi:hypothetical protein
MNSTVYCEDHSHVGQPGPVIHREDMEVFDAYIGELRDKGVRGVTYVIGSTPKLMPPMECDTTDILEWMTDELFDDTEVEQVVTIAEVGSTEALGTVDADTDETPTELHTTDTLSYIKVNTK